MDETKFIGLLLALPRVQKILKFRMKILLNLGKKFICLGIFKMEFEKAYVRFEINILKSFDKQSFVQERTSLNLGPKMPTGYLWAEI